MNTDLRNRVILPILLPLLLLLGIALLVGGLALVLLYNTHEVALTIALVVAAGIMVAFSLASSVEREDMTIGRRSVIVLTGLLPLLGGAGVAVWAANGGVPAEDLIINVEPHAQAPEGALIGAKNAESFCVFEEDGETCTDTSEVTFPAQPDSEAFFYVFDNIHSGVPHNAQLFEFAGTPDAPEPGDPLFGVEDGATVITGVAEITYEVTPNEFAEGDQYYYNCVVHPAMQGVLTIGPPADGEGGGGEGAGGGEGGGAEG